jgi:hypothetical protein
LFYIKGLGVVRPPRSFPAFLYLPTSVANCSCYLFNLLLFYNLSMQLWIFWCHIPSLPSRITLERYMCSTSPPLSFSYNFCPHLLYPPPHAAAAAGSSPSRPSPPHPLPPPPPETSSGNALVVWWRRHTLGCWSGFGGSRSPANIAVVAWLLATRITSCGRWRQPAMAVWFRQD